MTKSTTTSGYRFAYYVSGHGFGHATRVIACTLALQEAGHSVFIVSNAPKRIFLGAITAGAGYRQADIDAGISQPKAYDVDRKQTLQGLREFLDRHGEKVQDEVEWLKANRIQAVLVDAPFLPCAAARQAGLPAAIISNFSFDSVYSYLDAPAVTTSSTSSLEEDEVDEPLPTEDLEPLVLQTIADYSHASLLLRLPGAIPFPAIQTEVPLPSSTWVDPATKAFTPDIQELLQRRQQNIIDTPLIVRKPSSKANTPEFRAEILTEIGVPLEQQDRASTRILLVSFGGQSIPRPGSSRQPSPQPSPYTVPQDLPTPIATADLAPLTSSPTETTLSPIEASPTGASGLNLLQQQLQASMLRRAGGAPAMKRTATNNHLYLPGAPPASTHQTLSVETASPMQQLSSSPNSLLSPASASSSQQKQLVPNKGLLPPDWIALVCGLESSQNADELPQGFYACRSDIYVPDLCAICDAQLGKLGYGTCSETIAARLPFIYVSRPLFVEEYGLKRLSQSRNTLVEMDRTSFEEGRWATFIEQAWAEHQDNPPKSVEEKDAGLFIVEQLEKWISSQS